MTPSSPLPQRQRRAAEAADAKAKYWQHVAEQQPHPGAPTGRPPNLSPGAAAAAALASAMMGGAGPNEVETLRQENMRLRQELAMVASDSFRASSELQVRERVRVRACVRACDRGGVPACVRVCLVVSVCLCVHDMRSCARL